MVKYLKYLEHGYHVQGQHNHNNYARNEAPGRNYQSARGGTMIVNRSLRHHHPQPCVQTCVLLHICICVRVCMHGCVCMYKCMNVGMYECMHVFVRMHVCSDVLSV